MIRIFSLFFLLHVALFAYTHEDIINDYKEQRYKDICLKSAKFYKNAEKNEQILSIIGDACARIDYINPLGYIVRGLISTPEFRQNGSYFATLVLQKKLIYQFMHDKIDLKNLRLPRSNHTLSIVFENLVKKNYKKEDKKFIIKLKEKEYRVYLGDEAKRVVHVDEYKDGKIIKKHGYL
ncbi:hypothetical protein ACKGJI_05685 [Sulfurospirillum sp. 1307]|jgi:hypothetical protein